MRSSKPFIAVLSTMFVAASAYGQSVPGSTGADPTMQQDVTNMLMTGFEGNTGCKDTKVVDTKIVKVEEAPTAKVIERWIVDRCGKSVRYLVTFVPVGGGTMFGVEPEE